MPQVTFDLRGANARLLECRDTQVVACGMAGTGKSLAACLKLHLSALKYPGFKGMAVRATQVSLAATTLQTLQRQVLAEALATGDVRWYGGSAKDPAAFRYRNGSSITVGGADKPEKLLSLEVDRVLIDEAIEVDLEFVETLLTRLRGPKTVPYRQVMLATNPGHPSHWIKRLADQGKLTLLTSTHRDNPYYTNLDGTYTPEGAEYAAKLDLLTGTRRARLRDGAWVTAEGVVYEEFNEAMHVINAAQLPEFVSTMLTIDWGHTNPSVCAWYGFDSDGRMYLYRELYHTGVLVEDFARQVHRILTDHPDEPFPTDVVADHDSGDRATFERHSGLTTVPAKKTVLPGIDHVKARLKVQADGRPRFFVVRGCTVKTDQSLIDAGKPASTLEEFGGYVWDIRPGTVGMREQPLKKNDHGMDTVRYAVAHRDLVGESAVGSPAKPGKDTKAGGRFSRSVSHHHAYAPKIR